MLWTLTYTALPVLAHIASCCRTTLTTGDLQVEKTWQHRRQNCIQCLLRIAFAPKIFGVVDSTLAIINLPPVLKGKRQVCFHLASIEPSCRATVYILLCRRAGSALSRCVSAVSVSSVSLSGDISSHGPQHSTSVTYWAAWRQADITIIRCQCRLQV